jgi:hypothetical protein
MLLDAAAAAAAGRQGGGPPGAASAGGDAAANVLVANLAHSRTLRSKGTAGQPHAALLKSLGNLRLEFFGVVIDFQVSRWLDWIVNNASTPV